jgi:SpoIID/LytB domain protein
MTASDRRWVAVACASWAVAAVTILGGGAWGPLLAGQAPPSGAGYLLRSLQKPSDRQEARADLLDRPVLPGSVMKVVTLIAALEHGVIDADTSHVCRRRVVVDGVTFVCAHPDLRRPLNAAEALAYSCNDFFVSLAPRLTRDMFNRTRLAAGLPPVASGVPLTPALVGLDGPRVTPRTLLDLVARVAGLDRDRPMRLQDRTRRVLMEGLTGATTYGSASALGAAGISALAKTGTAPMPGGGAMGIAVALTPAERPERGIVVVAPGAAGLDAASIAATMLTGRDSTARDTSPRDAARADAQRPRQAAIPVVPASTTIRLGVTDDNGRTRVATVPLEDYVARVVAGEGEPRAGDAAQQALAITIRTFALANRNRHRREGFDLCDTTHCQVLRPATETTRRAASQTAGRILLHERQPAFVFYSAWCGGHVELASAVWPGALDYRTRGDIEDDACALEPGWTSDIRASDLERVLRAAGLRGDRLRDLRIESRNASGRAATLRAVGFSPSIVPAHDFRMAVGRVLGWQRMKSTAFDLDRTGAGYRFRGRGFGHGVGLCVVGAGFRAAAGASTDEILRFYFPGLEVSGASSLLTDSGGSLGGSKDPPLPGTSAHDPARTAAAGPGRPGTGGSSNPPGSVDPSGNLPGSGGSLDPPGTSRPVSANGIQLALPAEEERDRADVLRAVVAARQDIASRTGIAAPALIRVTVHPTVESFGRTTGQPWWVSAATLGAAIDMLPSTILRRQGLLERTLRHEIAHVLIDERLAGRPMWVREGAALYFSSPPDPATARPDGRVSCPSDQELLRPVSAGGQRDAYARAEACFRRAIANGRHWYDVK